MLKTSIFEVSFKAGRQIEDECQQKFKSDGLSLIISANVAFRIQPSAFELTSFPAR
jgi:hypothetical protein